MEGKCRVVIVGDSLFTETLVRILADTPEVEIVWMASSLASAAAAVRESIPHLIITAAGDRLPQDSLASLLTSNPDLAIISADLNRDYLQVITSQIVAARRQDLLAAIRSLHQDLSIHTKDHSRSKP